MKCLQLKTRRPLFLVDGVGGGERSMFKQIKIINVVISDLNLTCVYHTDRVK